MMPQLFFPPLFLIVAAEAWRRFIMMYYMRAHVYAHSDQQLQIELEFVWFFLRNIAPLGTSAPNVTVPDLNCPPFFGPLASGAAQQDSWRRLICIA